MQFGLLGTLEVVDDTGASVDLGGAQPRTVLAMLLVAGGQLVPAESLVDVIWGETTPRARAHGPELHLAPRRSLEPDRSTATYRGFYERGTRSSSIPSR
jgi:hypothetical protein